ncbi:hypothetical protein [Gracilibacillus xinjiangensis]|uniref:DUF4843 domain-containing protein n=1 Tax=Gracilibacillus xinjiangensis TaxID=1193282 RepID=A0ABV8WW47_9BACI
MYKMKYLIMSLTLIFVLGFILVSCNDIDRTPEGYKLPIAKYEQLDSEHFSVHIEVYEEDNGEKPEEKYATVVIHHFSESPISIPNDAIIPFQIKGTDLKGEAQLDILTTINEPEINSDEIQHHIENEKPMTVVLENYEEVNLIYRTPRAPSQ